MQVRTELGERSYPILIGSGLLGQAQTYEGLPRAAQALIVTNTTVAPLYAQALQLALQAHYGCATAIPQAEADADVE